MPPPPLALSPALPSELLTWILTHQGCSTTLLICQPRSTFLASLLESTSSSQPSLPLVQHPDNEEPPSSPPTSHSSPRHPLLIPTLHQIATSRYVNLVFIPTPSHLRAYLAVFPSDKPEAKRPPDSGPEKQEGENPLLVVYGIVGLHLDTSEWSAQGLGNSLAGLVEAGWRGRRGVVVIEERVLADREDLDGEIERAEDEGEDEEVTMEDQRKRKRCCEMWEQRVPMLNGSARRVGLESEDGGWSGRTVEVGRIMARWFKFGRGDWDIEEILTAGAAI